VVGVRKGSFLLVTHEASGHAVPELALAKRLVRRGHDVTLHAPEELADRAAATGCDVLIYTTDEPWNPLEGAPRMEVIAAARRRAGSPALAEDVKNVLDRLQPDVAIVDVVLSAAFAAAEAANTRTACVLPILYQPWHLWYGDLLQDANPARMHLGLRPLARQTTKTAIAHARLVLVLSSASFDYPASGRLDRRVRYVGRMIDPDPATWESPWPADDPCPLVIVTLSGFVRYPQGQVQQVLDALAERPVRMLVLIGLTIDENALHVPENAVVRRWVPHEAVLPDTSLVVTNGGHNSVLAALAHGVPVLVLPLMEEQAWNGHRAEAFGAGRTLATDATRDHIEEALDDLLFDPRTRERARNAAEAVVSDGGESAVDELERLLGRRWLR
jgi:UDP:flavonoid glycosyltransferase YjiC (YdhE family)